MNNAITTFTANLLNASAEQMNLIKSAFDWQPNPENSKELIIMVNEDEGVQALADILGESEANIPCGLFLCHVGEQLPESSEPNMDAITLRLDLSTIDSVIADCDFGERTFMHNDGAEYGENDMTADVTMYFEPVNEDGEHDEDANSEASYLYICFDNEEMKWTVSGEMIVNVSEVEENLNKLLLKNA